MESGKLLSSALPHDFFLFGKYANLQNKKIPYQEVVDLYKKAMNTDQDVEIKIE